MDKGTHHLLTPILLNLISKSNGVQVLIDWWLKVKLNGIYPFVKQNNFQCHTAVGEEPGQLVLLTTKDNPVNNNTFHTK